MSDITITNGLPDDAPWIFANTDTSNLDQTNLINLAVGKLALLGASQGQTLQTQTGVLKELVGSVGIVNDVLTSLGSGWGGETTNLGFPAESIGFTNFGVYVTFREGFPRPIPPDTYANMISATEKMNQLGVQFGGFDAYSYTLHGSFGGAYLERLVLTRPPYVGTITSTASVGAVSLSTVMLGAKFANLPLADGQVLLLTGPDDAPTFPGFPNEPKTFTYVYYSGSLYRENFNFQGTRIGTLTGMAIPSTAAELSNWELQAKNTNNLGGVSSAQLSINNTASLTSTFELAPRTNTSPADSDAILLGIVDASSLSYDMARYKAIGSNNEVFLAYQPYPPTVVSALNDSSLLITANVGKVFEQKIGSNSRTAIITADNYGRISFMDVSETTKYVSKASSDEILKWRSQYAEKIIIITQRSSDQQLFVTNLAQKYQYAFDAATYVLKAFTSALSSTANNI